MILKSTGLDCSSIAARTTAGINPAIKAKITPIIPPIINAITLIS